MTSTGSRPDLLAPLLARPGVEEAVARTRSAVDSVLNHRVVRRRSPDVSSESSLRGVWASSVLAGSARSLDEVRTGEATADPVVQGALRAYSALGEVAPVWTHSPAQTLARLHVLAAADLVEDPELLGRPVQVRDVPVRLAALGELLSTSRAPAVVLASLAHAEIASLDAFTPTSEVLACVAGRLVLIDKGLDPKSLVPVEAGHVADITTYRTALAGYATGSADGVVSWVRYYADALVDGARESLAICEAIQRG